MKMDPQPPSPEKEEQKRCLRNTLENLDEGQLRNAAYNLFKAGFNELSADVLKIILCEVTEIILSGSEKDILVGDIVPGGFTAWQNSGKEVLQNQAYYEIGEAVGKLRAAYKEQVGDYEHAAKFYESIGMTGKAQEMKGKKQNVREIKLKLEEEPLFNEAVQEFRSKFKDVVLLSGDERKNILENVRQRIQAELGE